MTRNSKSNSKGNRANVLKRWGRYQDDRQSRSKRDPFNGTPQFPFDDIYISPFSQELTTDEVGRKVYKPVIHNMSPTGINVMDAYVQALYTEMIDVASFCKRYNLKSTDLDGLVFVLTGMSNQQLRARWIIRCADELLRYTDLDIPEVARRSGAGTRVNLYFIYERDLNCSPTARRDALRQKGDLGKYKL